MRNQYNIQKRLLEIKSEFNGRGNFSINTMSKVEKRAREIKVLVVDALGRDNEIFSELDTSIKISEKYHRAKKRLAYDEIKQALIHLEYSIELFLTKI